MDGLGLAPAAVTHGRVVQSSMCRKGGGPRDGHTHTHITPGEPRPAELRAGLREAFAFNPLPCVEVLRK